MAKFVGGDPWVGMTSSSADRLDQLAHEPATFAAVQSGAYGFTANPLGFLSHPRPAEVLV